MHSAKLALKICAELSEEAPTQFQIVLRLYQIQIKKTNLVC